jgi:hypothetical protein
VECVHDPRFYRMPARIQTLHATSMQREPPLALTTCMPTSLWSRSRHTAPPQASDPWMLPAVRARLVYCLRLSVAIGLTSAWSFVPGALDLFVPNVLVALAAVSPLLLLSLPLGRFYAVGALTMLFLSLSLSLSLSRTHTHGWGYQVEKGVEG